MDLIAYQGSLEDVIKITYLDDMEDDTEDDTEDNTEDDDEDENKYKDIKTKDDNDTE
jgi:hypothetical protein